MDWDAIWALRDTARGPSPMTPECVQMCTHDETVENKKENIVSCMYCGLILESNHIVDLSTWRPGVELSRRSIYKRRHHFNERLLQFMGLDRVVPDQILFNAKKFIQPPYNKTKIRFFLRSNGLQRYIENWIQVYCFLQGIPAPGLTLGPQEVRWLESMFLHIEAAFEKTKPRSRSSMLNYNFVFVRLLQIMDRKDLIQWFPQLKSRAKTKALDAMWVDIAKNMQLPHLPLPTVKALR